MQEQLLNEASVAFAIYILLQTQVCSQTRSGLAHVLCNTSVFDNGIFCGAI